MSSSENLQQKVIAFDASSNRVSFVINSPAKRKTFSTSKNEHPAKKPCQSLDSKDIQTTAGGLKFTQHGIIFQLDLLTLALYRANYHDYEDFGLAKEIPDAEKFHDIVFVREKNEGNYHDHKDFKLATEILDAEKFDDIVFIREKDGRKQVRLIQAKHSEGKIKEISKDDLLSKNFKDPFRMPKYFESYLKIEENCKNYKSYLYNCEIEDIMIVTNRSISNDLQKHVKGERIQNDNLLYTPQHANDKAQRYSIQKGQLYDRLTKIFIGIYKDIEKQKVKENEEAKDIESKAENAVDEFFKKFRLVVDYPNRTALEKMLEDELQEDYKILDSRAKLDILRIEMYEWLSDQKTSAFNFKSAGELFARIEEKVSCYEIYGITKSNLESIPDQYHFQNDELLKEITEFLNSDRILLALEFDTLGLGWIRTAQTFKQLKQLKTAEQQENNEQHSENDGQRRSWEKLKSYIYQFGHIFINSEESQNRNFYEYLKKRLPDKGKWNLIIIELDDIQQDLYSSVIEHITKLDKKVILIISKERKKMLSPQVQNNILKVETNFMHLKPDSQKSLFETETVLFQETSQHLNKLLCQQNQNVIDAIALDRFIYRKEVRIGKPFVYKAYVESSNIERHLSRKICIQSRIKKHLFRASFTKNIFYFPLRPTKNNLSDVIVINRIREDFENDAETIECENMHWLQDIDGKLIWTQTKGNVSKLAAYRSSDTSNQVKSSTIEESSFIQGTEKIVIISGQHGTGKSTLFGSLEKKLKQTNGLIWTIRIDLQHYSSFLIDKSKETQIPGANIQTWAIDLLVKLLQSNDSINQFTPLEERFFRSVLERQKTDSGGTEQVRIALFIDEISEINLICQGIVLDMLAGLKSTAVYRVFILTRPATRSTLEVKLGTFTYNIEPLSESNQIDFFKAHQLNDKNIDKRCNYIPLCLEIISKINDISQTEVYSNDPFDLFEMLQAGQDNSSDMQNEFERIFKKYFPSDDTQQRDFDINTLKTELHSSILKIEDNLTTPYKDYLVVKFLGDCLLNSNLNKVLFDVLFGEILQNMEYPFIRALLNSWWKKHGAQIPSDSVEKLTDHLKSIEGNLRRKISCTILNEGHCELLKMLPNTDFSTIELTTAVVPSLVNLKPNFDVNALFLKAAESGNVDVCEWLLNAKILNLSSKLNDKIYDIDILKMLESNGVTEIILDDSDKLLELFVQVAKFGNKKSFEWLLQHGLKIDTISADGSSLLHIAAEFAPVEFFRWLLLENDAKQLINIQNHSYSTPLHVAIANNNAAAVEILTEYGANVKLVDNNGFTILHHAAKYGNREICWHILRFYQDVDPKEKTGKTPLHIASLENNLEAIKLLIGKLADASIADEEGWTTLHFAAASGNGETILYALDFSKDINAETKSGRTPLHCAVQKNNIETAKVLIEKSADVNIVDEDGLTILHYAARWGNRETILYVLDFCKDINGRVKDGRTPLHCAVAKSNLETAKVLIEKNADVSIADEDGWTILHYAARWGNRETILYVLDFCKDINGRAKDGRTPLHCAVAESNLETAKLLIEKNANVSIANESGWTILHRAAACGNRETILYVLDFCKDINCRTKAGRTPLHYAVCKSNLETAKVLIEKSADVSIADEDGWTILHYAAARGNRETILNVLDFCKDINIRTKNGRTPLHCAVENNNLETAKVLIEKKADVNIADEDGLTILHSAAASGNQGTILYVLDFCKDINGRVKDGRTPLHCAVEKSNIETAKVLIERNADVSIADEDGLTILHSAAASGNQETILYVLDFCKYINVRTKNDRTPLHCAVAKNNLETAKILIEKNANVSIADENGWSILHYAAAVGNRKTILYVLDFFKDINAGTKSGRTPLHCAVAENNLETAKILIEKNANVSIADENGWSILHYAAAVGNRKTILYVLDFCKDINVRTKNGSTPLHNAVGKSNLETAKVLIEKNAKNRADKNGWSNLHYAAACGNRETILYVLDFCKYINVRTENGRTPLHCAVEESNLETAKVLIEKNANVSIADKVGGTILHYAAVWGNQETILYVLDFCKDINVRTENGRTPLHCAVQNSNLETAKVLIEKNANVRIADENGLTILHYAAVWGNQETILYVLHFCKDINGRIKDGRAPLHFAVEESNLETAKTLIENNADVSIADENSKTIWHVVVKQENCEMCLKLLDCIKIKNTNLWSECITLAMSLADQRSLKMKETLLNYVREQKG